MRTGKEYLEALKRRKPVVYHLGKKIENLLEHPILKYDINVNATAHDLSFDQECQDVLTANSSLTGERVNRYLNVFGSREDLALRQKQARLLLHRTGSCTMKCPGLGGVNAIYSTTFEMDKKLGTSYHQRFLKFLKEAQEKDWFLAGCMMDPKGDRSLRPYQQADPDMYLRIVEKKKDGIVVRGAKVHTTGPMIADELVVLPCEAMKDDREKPYAVSFAIPVDTRGITYIMQHNLADGFAMNADENDLGNWKFASHFGATTLTIFDDVFIPEERIFMQGELEFTGMLVSRMGTMARMWQCGCRPGIFDMVIGATKLIAEYNGIASSAHVIDKLTEMSYLSETVWGLALGAASTGKPTSSGAFLPDGLLTNIAKLQSTRAYYEIVKMAIDIAGGLIVTLPSFKDQKNPDTGHYIDKYLKGVDQVSASDRMRVLRFLQGFVGGPVAGALHHSGGPMQNQKIVIYRETDFEEKKKRVKELAGIKS